MVHIVASDLEELAARYEGAQGRAKAALYDNAMTIQEYADACTAYDEEFRAREAVETANRPAAFAKAYAEAVARWDLLVLPELVR